MGASARSLGVGLGVVRLRLLLAPGVQRQGLRDEGGGVQLGGLVAAWWRLGGVEASRWRAVCRVELPEGDLRALCSRRRRRQVKHQGPWPRLAWWSVASSSRLCSPAAPLTLTHLKELAQLAPRQNKSSRNNNQRHNIKSSTTFQRSCHEQASGGKGAIEKKMVRACLIGGRDLVGSSEQAEASSAI